MPNCQGAVLHVLAAGVGLSRFKKCYMHDIRKVLQQLLYAQSSPGIDGVSDIQSVDSIQLQCTHMESVLYLDMKFQQRNRTEACASASGLGSRPGWLSRKSICDACSTCLHKGQHRGQRAGSLACLHGVAWQQHSTTFLQQQAQQSSMVSHCTAALVHKLF